MCPHAGFAYKKNTSDTRHTVAIDVCNYLLAERARLSIHDPRVAAEAIGIHFSGGGLDQLVKVETDPYAACDGAHALILLTEWDMYAELDFEKVYETMSRPAHLEVEYVFMYPNQRPRGHVFSRIRPYSAVFTVFFSVVFTRCSEYAAQDRIRALKLAYSTRRRRSGSQRSWSTVRSTGAARTP